MISRNSAMFQPRCVDSNGKWVLFQVSVARMAYDYIAMFFQQSWSYIWVGFQATLYQYAYGLCRPDLMGVRFRMLTTWP